MKKENVKLLIRIIIIILFLTLININQSFALTSKEDVDKYMEIVEEGFKINLKKNKMKDGRMYFRSDNYSAIDGRTYFSYSSSMIPDTLEDDYYKMEDTLTNTFKEYFNKNLDENLPSEKRLVNYIITVGSTYTRQENYKEGDDIEAKIGAIVFPASEKTVWAKDNEKVVGKEYDKEAKEMFEIEGYATKDYYIHLKMQDGKYVITYLDTMPEGYTDFVQRMKVRGIDLENINYAELINGKSETEIIAKAVEKENHEMANIINIKSNINVIIIIICSLGIVTTFSICLIRFRKNINAN